LLCAGTPKAAAGPALKDIIPIFNSFGGVGVGLGVGVGVGVGVAAGFCGCAYPSNAQAAPAPNSFKKSLLVGLYIPSPIFIKDF